MTKREVVIEALEFRPPPYVPWAWGMTEQCAEKMKAHLHTTDLSGLTRGHFLTVTGKLDAMERVDADHVRDAYGVVWDRSVDRDIGTPVSWPIRRPEDLAAYRWPEAADEACYAGIASRLAADQGRRLTMFMRGFSLYERAWTMRGMAELLMDMVERPEFVESFLDRIVEHNLVQVRRALRFGVDAVYFGDDYGMQTGLIMGIEHWRHFLKPRLARMFAPVREAGKYVFLHSCGCVASLFDDLAEIGLNCFNPFQPEVMDVHALVGRYRGRLAFHGGMSVQKILPFGTVAEVRSEARKLLRTGRHGGFIFSPSHAVPRDVPAENLLAMAEVLLGQEGYTPDSGSVLPAPLA